MQHSVYPGNLVSWCFEPTQPLWVISGLTKVWLPMLGIFNMHTDDNACDCTRGLYGHRKRVCTEKSLVTLGNRSCFSGMPVRCPTKWATFLSQLLWHNTVVFLFLFFSQTFCESGNTYNVALISGMPVRCSTKWATFLSQLPWHTIVVFFVFGF